MDEKVKESDVTLEANAVASWDMVHHGAVGGTYMGTFKFKCYLNPIQLIEADRDFRELLGPNSQFAATNAENIAYSLAQLKQRVISAPPFWTETYSRFPGGGVKDIDVLELVLEAAIVAEVKYRKDLNKKHEDAISRIKQTIENRQKAEAEAREIATNKELEELDKS